MIVNHRDHGEHRGRKVMKIRKKITLELGQGETEMFYQVIECAGFYMKTKSAEQMCLDQKEWVKIKDFRQGLMNKL